MSERMLSDGMDSNIRLAVSHGCRVRVSSSDGWLRSGVVAMSAGPVPCFILIGRSDLDAGYALGPDDRVVAIQWDGRRYSSL